METKYRFYCVEPITNRDVPLKDTQCISSDCEIIEGYVPGVVTQFKSYQEAQKVCDKWNEGNPNNLSEVVGKLY